LEVDVDVLVEDAKGRVEVIGRDGIEVGKK
jgi:hypothetical protein